jgi:hypothetical protein
MRCPLCGVRNARRACPGVGNDICAVCCGTKRLVEIACPSTCVYLGSAQRHPAAVVKRQQEHDITMLMTTLGRVSERQLQLFFVIHTFIARFQPPPGLTGLSRVSDADVADAAGALAASFETAARGVLYEHPAGSMVGEALRRELKTFLAELGKGGGSRFEREASEVLRGIERGARHDAPGLEPGELAYLTLVARVLQERPPAAAAPSSIVLP